MHDFTGRIFAVILCFLMLIIAPIIIVTIHTDYEDREAIIDEVTNFMDEIADTKKISDNQLADLQLGCASYGPLVQVTVYKKVKTVEPDPINGGTRTTYVYSDNISQFSTGDFICVRVHTIGYTGSQKLTMSLTGLFTGRFERTFAKRVR